MSTATATKTESPVYVGDIFHGSFGYDMTIGMARWEPPALAVGRKPRS